jgi:hypothetical protein
MYINGLILASTVLTGCQTARQIQNPYRSVDWAKSGQYKANLLTHTMVSGCWMNPQTVVKKYLEPLLQRQPSLGFHPDRNGFCPSGVGFFKRRYALETGSGEGLKYISVN